MIKIMEFDELEGTGLSDSDRRTALLSVIGLWKDRTDLPDTEQYIRALRTGDRLQRVPESAGN